MTDSDRLDNLLVNQKNAIFALINQDAFASARTVLSAVKESWADCDYGYKWDELDIILRARLDQWRYGINV